MRVTAMNNKHRYILSYFPLKNNIASLIHYKTDYFKGYRQFKY